MATVQELVTIGERMGLQDDDLREFVKEQQAIAREDRQKDRERGERERKNREREREDRDKQRAFEYRKLELKIKKIEATAKVPLPGSEHEFNDDDDDDDEVVQRPHSKHTVRDPKMAPFDERDDMDSYLHRFEPVSYTHLTLPTNREV